MKKNSLYLILLTLTLLLSGFQKNVKSVKYSENHARTDSSGAKSQYVSLMFWNVENLYDPYNDTLTLDDEFTAGGIKRWTTTRFHRKLNHTAKTILASGGFHPPDLIGLCEIENRMVLQKLLRDTPLKKFHYEIVQYDSPDLRGVDVAFLYSPQVFKSVSDRKIRISFSSDTSIRTRDILMVKGVLKDRDTLFLFINHWPSRRGGQVTSEPRRMETAKILRRSIDSLLSHENNPNIIIMGDFNDEPENVSIKNGLNAKTEVTRGVSDTLYNLMGIRNKTRMEGTLKFRDQWTTFDQFMVSGTLFHGFHGLKADHERTSVYYGTFLTEEDLTNQGVRLKRTYAGPRYLGGFSDHLPILLKINILTTP